MSASEIKIGSVIWWTGPAGITGHELYRGFYRVEKVLLDKIILSDNSGNAYTAFEGEVTEWP